MGVGTSGRRLLVAIALAVAVNGCGDDGSDEGVAVTPGAAAPAGTAAPAQASLDAREFRARADERCARTFVELDRVEYPAEDALPSIAAPFRQVASINREQLDDLRALTPPAADEEAIADLLDTASLGVDAIDELVLAAAADDLPAYNAALAVIEQRAQQTADRAGAYGFATCFVRSAG